MEKFNKEKFGMVFPGQGSNLNWLCNGEFGSSKIIKDTFQEASDILGVDFIKLSRETDKSKIRLEDTTPLIFTSSIAAFRYYKDLYEEIPLFMAGHSLGEYSALTCAECLSLEESLKLITVRAKLAQDVKERTKACMMVVSRIESNLIEVLCRQLRDRGKQVWISCYNADSQSCVCGTKEDLMELEKYVLKFGGRVLYLSENAPFHSKFMEEVKEELARHLQKIPWKKGNSLVFSSTYCMPFEPDCIASFLTEQMVEPVRWVDVMEYMERLSLYYIVECGNNNILKRLMKRNMPNVSVVGFATKEEIVNLKSNERRNVLSI